MTIVSFAVGVGNVEGFIISEIMPVYAKDTLASIGQPLNWIANLMASQHGQIPTARSSKHMQSPAAREACPPVAFLAREERSRRLDADERLPAVPWCLISLADGTALALQVSTAFPLVFGLLGRNTYLIFVALTAFFGWFTLTRVPETRGKTYEQVAKEFARY